MAGISEALSRIIDMWIKPFEVLSIQEHGNGLINSTYKIETKGEENPDFILQKINHNIFKDVDGLQNNIIKVTNHIRSGLIRDGVKDFDRRVLTLHYLNLENNYKGNDEGRLSWYKDEEGGCWRIFKYIPNTRSYEKMTSPAMAELSGRAFGNFHKQLSDFDGESLCEVIPGFHNTPMRIENLRKRVAADPVGRLKEVEAEVEFLLSRAGEYSKIVEMGDAGLIPKRVVHQDTKFNNVLLDSEDNILCVIDLDTVMPGYICYDVGDAIRTGANKGLEDDENLDNVEFDVDIYNGFIKGFTAETHDMLTPAEADTLAFGPRLLTYEQAVRFLDDYLDGDNYYKCRENFPQHNLVRARAQIKLLQSMEKTLCRSF